MRFHGPRPRVRGAPQFLLPVAGPDRCSLISKIPEDILLAGNVARVESFISGATLEQVALFDASCAERSSGILFWIVSSEGREGDLEIYRRSLDYLWGRV